LNFKTDEKRIMDSFEQYGKIRKVTLVRNIHTDKSKGYGFIEFYEEKHA
jgi:RNA recognition motif-containing protein